MDDKVVSLMKKAQKYLRSAAVLLELEDFDSCASRAYFAMFFSAQALLLKETKRFSTNQGIRTSFVQTFVDSGRLPRRAATALNHGSQLQEVADYGYAFAVGEEQAEELLQEAEAFVNSIDRLIFVGQEREA